MSKPFVHSAKDLLVVAVLTIVSIAHQLDAQRRDALQSKASTSGRGSTSVRAELASVLMQSKRYAEAEREYRALLAGDPSNFNYRLGLARALAWGDRPREAERELRTLQRQRPQDGSIETLLRSVREAMTPTSFEARAWVREGPDYGPYRVALARAYTNERQGRLAAAQFDTILTRGGIGQLPSAQMLRREQAHAYVIGGDLSNGASRLRDLLRITPADTSARHELAFVLVEGGWLGEARAQYDTLLAPTPSATLLMERARVRIDMGDQTGAESDLQSSLALELTVPASLLLGDLYRERGNFGAARNTYRNALISARASSDRNAVLVSLARLAREARPVAAFATTVGDDPGWRMSVEGAGDNLGVRYTATTLRRTLALTDAASAGVTVLHQYLGERSAARIIDLQAIGATASLAQEIAYGSFLGRVGVTGGGLHVESGVVPIASGTAAAWLNAWELSLEAATGPAYPSLLTTTAVSPTDGIGEPLTEQDVSATLGGPAGLADFAATAQRSRLSDGNSRVTLQAFFRFPLAPGVSAIYQGTSVSFAKRSTQYWDPLDYMAHGAGLEIGVRRFRGLSAALRALPGVAKSTELLLPTPSSRTSRRTQRNPAPVTHSALQFGADGTIGWRDERWEAGAALTYGRGRAGDYQRVGLSLGARLTP